MDRADSAVADFLEHYGVKGMKWGVRKSDPAAGPKTPKGELVLEHSFKSGDKLSIYRNPPSLLARGLSKLSKSYAKDVKNYPQFNFYDKTGARVGEGAFVRNKDQLYLDWVTVKTKHRGKGYASAAMKGVLKYAQNEGIKKMTLEVPGNAPDAQHIYEKMGFKLNGKDSPPDGPHDPWQGLKGMEMDVPQKRVKHAAQTEEEWEEEFANEFAQLLIDNFGGSMQQSDPVDDFLEHFGVKGMKWGVRKKDKPPASADSARTSDIRAKGKAGKTRALSNAELRTAIERMQLEQNYKRLAVNDKPVVTRFISSTLLEIGKREVQAAAAKKIGAIIAKKVATGGLA